MPQSSPRPVRSTLAVLRRQIGLSHAGYARLVAETHEELGFGHTAARREKIARWESGNVTPELTAQLTIAHIHDIPADEVLRRSWPDWLLWTTGLTALIEAPWTIEQTLAAFAHALHSGAEPLTPSPLAVVGPHTSAALSTMWHAAMAAPAVPLTRTGRAVGTAVVEELVASHYLKLRIVDVLGPRLIFPRAQGDLRALAMACRQPPYSTSTGARLFSAAASAACLCGWLATELGDLSAAQSYFLTAIRAAATAKDSYIGGFVFILMAELHLTFGDHRDAMPLLRTARASLRPGQAGPRLSALLNATLATAYALQGDFGQFERYTDEAFARFDAPTNGTDSMVTNWVTRDRLRLMAGIAALHVGDATMALTWFAHLLDVAKMHRSATMLPRQAALLTAHAGRAHLAMGDVDSASLCAATVSRYLGDAESHRVSVTLSQLLSALGEYRLTAGVVDLGPRTGSRQSRVVR